MSNPRDLLPGMFGCNQRSRRSIIEVANRDLSVYVNLASQSIPTWNRIVAWLKEMKALKTVAL
jgi:hypothetical protein